MSNARKLADNLPSVGQLGGRNLIINGKFDIDQRHDFASHTVSAGSDFFADRWGFYTDSGAFAQYGATTQVVADGPTGFEKSLKWTTTSAGTIPATGEVIFRQKIEGYNIAQVDYGTSNAKELTLSFYVKSSIAGNYGFTAWFNDSGGTNRYNLRSYTINSANTWEYKTISIPANTAHVMGKKTNLDGINLNWDLGEGTTYSGSVTGNWQSTYVNGLTGGVKIADNNGATWQITGVQLEVGSQSTPFEHELVSTTLEKCQRYYYAHVTAGSIYKYIGMGDMYTNTQLDVHVNLPVPMRTTPTLVATSGSNYYRGYGGNSGGGYVSGAWTIWLVSDSNTTVSIYATSGNMTAGHAMRVITNNTSAAIAYDAEL